MLDKAAAKGGLVQLLYIYHKTIQIHQYFDEYA